MRKALSIAPDGPWILYENNLSLPLWLPHSERVANDICKFLEAPHKPLAVSNTVYRIGHI